MRIYCPSMKYVYNHRPFAGGLGAALYVGIGSPQNIRYRRGLVPDGCDFALWGPASDFGGDVVKKTLYVETIKSPTAQFSYTIPAAYYGEEIYFQVRTHEADIENESIYRPQALQTDESGNGVNEIRGRGRFLSVEKRDGGTLRFRFVYDSVRDGLQPSQFVITKTAGPGSVDPVAVTHSGKRYYELDVPSLADATEYTFQLSAENGPTTAVLDSLTATADAAGPPAITGLTAEEC
ncbi:hypothetical protein V6x_28630 [Gimesia chilikensis]|uniref:Uncharacterized protein n=1 Tax=Gimesia chilikensis TaxID=2605989 RepID=A0A517WD07_9PLAN|nr:hypothetical protein [Gimesia chilikensis]QDU03151.1 hypothetical protein V6x_28630 [Gimesia chilikensis]